MNEHDATETAYRNGYADGKPKWISVKDRLPESGVHVLLCCEMHRYGGEIAGKYVCDGYYAEANKIIAGGFPDECDCEYSEEDDEFYLCEGWYEVIKNWDNYNSVTVGDFVTHWMPLPEPQEENDKPMTNADRIRAMTDEELAKCIFEIGFDCHLCSEHERLSDNPLLRHEKCDEKCTEHCLEWLQQPAEEV